MIYNIAINSNKTQAYLYYSTGRIVGLYCSEGRVLDLVAHVLKPHGSEVQTVQQLMVSQDDTNVIELDKVS